MILYYIIVCYIMLFSILYYILYYIILYYIKLYYIIWCTVHICWYVECGNNTVPICWHWAACCVLAQPIWHWSLCNRRMACSKIWAHEIEGPSKINFGVVFLFKASIFPQLMYPPSYKCFSKTSLTNLIIILHYYYYKHSSSFHGW